MAEEEEATGEPETEAAEDKPVAADLSGDSALGKSNDAIQQAARQAAVHGPPSPAQEASLAGSAASFPSAQPSATAAPDASVPQGPIGAAGGVFRGEGAQIIVPADALTAEVSFKIPKVMARIAMTTHDVRVCRAP